MNIKDEIQEKFTEEEVLIIMEIADVILSGSISRQDIGWRIDMSDNILKELSQKITDFMEVRYDG